MKTIFSAALLCFAVAVKAQDSSSQTPSPLTVTGYVEAYYGYDFNRPANNTRPSFLYSHNRNNEFTVNLAFAKLAYATDRVRANISLAAGTYMNANYAAEPGVLKNILEANVGVGLSKKHQLWLDIGILPSHIGFESAIGKDNWTVTRSLVAENSPYFESGAKLGYTTNNGKFAVSLLALNGWQRITRVEGNSLMSWGTQWVVKPNSKITLNYSNFLGTDKPDSARLWRSYHNIYGIFQLSDRWGITAGFDLGTEQVAKGSNSNNTWFTPVLLLRYQPDDHWAVAVRGEYFKDEKGVIIATGTTNGFNTTGYSMNIDYLPIPNVAIRLEGRLLQSEDAIFLKKDITETNSSGITLAVAAAF